jgi:nucleoid-associated protein YgaU
MDGDRPRAKLTSLVLVATAAVAVAVAVHFGTREPPAMPEIAAAPAPAVEPLAEAEPGAPEPSRPAFDLVRVEPDGSAVIAGTAEPGAEVTIFADEAPLAHVEADAEGNFVAVFRAEPTAAPRALTLGASTPDGPRATSDEVVMLLPPAPAPPAAEPTPRPDESAAAPPPAPVSADPASAGPASEPGTAAVATAEPAQEVAATAILRSDGIVVSPVGARDGKVSLASIAYAEAGEVMLAGLGAAGAPLRAYVDDRLAEEATVGEDGRWSIALADVDAGLYTLRIDQLAPDGRVASRIETPFQRDYPRAPLPRPGVPDPVPAEGAITVQPGHNLWTLARLHYGSGVMYTQIFTANRDLIRDPDLIYPGQIFALPESDRND